MKSELYLTAKDNFTATLKKVRDITKSFGGDLDGMQKRLKALNEYRATLKFDVTQAKRAAKDAAKAFEELGDEASRLDFENAENNAKRLSDDMREVERNIRKTQKAMSDLSDEGSKAENTPSRPDAADVGKAILGSQLVSQLGSALSQSAGAFVSSAYGRDTAATVSTVTGGAISGLGGGAGLGFMIAGPIGAAVGAAVGGALGTLTGFIQDAARKREEADDYFRGTVQDIYTEVLATRVALTSQGPAVAASREKTLMAFNTMLGEDAADAFLSELEIFSMHTPFEYDALASVSKTLMAFGYAAEDIIPTLKKIGDAGSALGWDTASQMAVATYLGRMQVTGKASLEYLNPLLERGIDVYGYLAESLKPVLGDVTNKEIAEMLSKGELSGEGVAKTILQYLGEDYGGAMEDFAQSTAGLESTMSDWETALNAAFGEGYNKQRREQMKTQISWYEKNEDDLKRMYGLVGEYEANIVGTKEENFRGAMDAAIEQSKDITDPTQMSQELYNAIADAKVQYFDTDAYTGLYNSQIALVERIQQDLGEAKEGNPVFDAGKALGDVFTKGWQAAIDAFEPEFERPKYTTGEGGVPTDAELGSMENPFGYLDAWMEEDRGGNHAFGLSRVPYDDYPARLHEGERVLTAAQAREADRQGGARVVITGNVFNVREENDIDAIAEALYEKLAEAEAAYIN